MTAKSKKHPAVLFSSVTILRMFRLFVGPTLVSLLIFFAAYWFGGVGALSVVFFLSLLEISLSFDNAVINAKILTKMEEKWRQRFLTWGMLLAVFGTRLVLPILVVSIAAGVSPIAIGFLLFVNPDEYAKLADASSSVIHAFGGAFLLMVALRYFFDQTKSEHWITVIEKRLTVWGRVEAIEVMLTLMALLTTSFFVPGEATHILTAGCIGIILFIIIEGVVQALGAPKAGIERAGLGLFIYLNLLDAAFSLDGVIGAFALSTQILVIIAGLGIGAYFVRTLTVYFVRRHVLATLVYLEHGAYWAICALAICMFLSIGVPLPDALVGTISILFIGSAYVSSLRERRGKQVIEV